MFVQRRRFHEPIIPAVPESPRHPWDLEDPEDRDHPSDLEGQLLPKSHQTCWSRTGSAKHSTGNYLGRCWPAISRSHRRQLEQYRSVQFAPKKHVENKSSRCPESAEFHSTRW